MYAAHCVHQSKKKVMQLLLGVAHMHQWTSVHGFGLRWLRYQEDIPKDLRVKGEDAFVNAKESMFGLWGVVRLAHVGRSNIFRTWRTTLPSSNHHLSDLQVVLDVSSMSMTANRVRGSRWLKLGRRRQRVRTMTCIRLFLFTCSIRTTQPQCFSIDN